MTLFAVGPRELVKRIQGVAMAVKALKESKVKRITTNTPAVEAGENLVFYLVI
jgi:phosphate starvation-inducible protein PhoH